MCVCLNSQSWTGKYSGSTCCFSPASLCWCATEQGSVAEQWISLELQRQTIKSNKMTTRPALSRAHTSAKAQQPCIIPCIIKVSVNVKPKPLFSVRHTDMRLFLHPSQTGSHTQRRPCCYVFRVPTTRPAGCYWLRVTD